MFILILFALWLGMILCSDWLFYKLRGRAQPDSEDPNSLVITNGEDATAQRLVDLGKREKKGKNNSI